MMPHFPTGLTRLAAMIAGYCTQLILFGIVVVVYWSYLGSPAAKASSWFHRLSFTLVFVLTTVHTALCVHDLMWYSTTISLSFQTLVQGTVPQAFEAVLTAVISALVQIVLAVRVSKIIESRWLFWTLFVAIGSLVVLEVLAALVVSLYSFHYVKGAQLNFPINFETSIEIWMFLSAGADVLITSIFIFVIYKKVDSGDSTTRSVVNLLAQGAVQSASYTALFAVATAVTAKVNFFNLTPYAFWLELPSLYALSLVSTLSIGDRVSNKMRRRADKVVVSVITMSHVDYNTDPLSIRATRRAAMHTTNKAPDWTIAPFA